MAYVVLTINLPNFSVQECNNRSINDADVTDSIKANENLLRGIIAGNYPANVQVTTRNTDPAVTTDGGASTQANYNHL